MCNKSFAQAQRIYDSTILANELEKQKEQEAENVVDTATLNNLDIDKEEISESEKSQEEQLKEKYNLSKKNEKPYLQRTIEDTAWKKWIDDKKFIYDEQKEKKQKAQSEIKDYRPNWNFDFFNKSTGTVILYILIALIIVMIIYAFFGKQYFNKKDKALVVEEMDWENVEVFSDWDKAINDSIAKNDFRLATRILYLQTLQIMNDKNIIIFKKETLSSSYLQKLYNTANYKPFSEITRLFDYIWYGNYNIDSATFNQIKIQFNHFQNSLV